MIIWIQGPSGSGKTTVGRRLAEMRGVPFIDLDEEIERVEGRSILDIFSEGGEPAFRRMEWNALFGLLDRDSSPKVVALGGGAVIDPTIRGAIRASGVRVTLDCDADTAIARLESDATPRPLLFEESPVAAWRRLHRQRSRFYAETDISVDAGGSPDDVATRVAEELRLLDDPLWTIDSVLAGERSTLSSWRSLYALAGRLRALVSGGPLCIVADASIASAYPEYCDPEIHGDGVMVTVEAGEAHKSLKTIEELAAAMACHGCTRQTTIVGIGGGVVTDITGFLSSVYMRGVRSIYIPTTLLAQVDAAIGGKTAVNAAGVRNLIGTFKQPEHVLVGSGFLRTLPARELRSGFVESLKMGIANSSDLASVAAAAAPAIIDGELPANIDELLRLSVATKLDVVERDTHDASLRLSLNLGHTFGHALEAAEPDSYAHGEAVAFGLIASAWMSRRLGIIGDVRFESIVTSALPFTLHRDAPHPVGRIIAAMESDKKRAAGGLRFVLPAESTGVELRTVTEHEMIAGAVEFAFEEIGRERGGKMKDGR